MSWTIRARVWVLQSLIFALWEVFARALPHREALTTNAWGLTVLQLDHHRSRSVHRIETRVVWRICCRSLVPEVPLHRSSGRRYLRLCPLAWPLPLHVFDLFEGEVAKNVAIELLCL